MKTIVVKFGGSSLASAEQIKKAVDIIQADPSRRYVVCSAPGKRNKEDTKVTDYLLQCYEAAQEGRDFEPELQQIEARFQNIIYGLGIEFDLKPEIEKMRDHLSNVPSRDYMASRGEYLNSRIIAAYLNLPFVDPAKTVVFREDGGFDAEKTNQKMAMALLPLERAVIAGFYGARTDGTIKTFARGGSDITGSIVARAVQADLYENWTDVSGMLRADPRVVENPQVIDYISYNELRELSYMGSSVFQEDAVFPVRKAGIPINIRNTNAPEDPGTMIVASLPKILPHRVLTGIAGKKGFASIQIEKAMMNAELGFGAKLLNILVKYGISFEHIPTGIDTMSVLISADDLNGKKEELVREIQEVLVPDALFIEENLALVAVVGHGMAYTKGVAARIFQAVSDAGVNIRMIDQGSSELNVIIGIEERDYEKAICSIYQELIH